MVEKRKLSSNSEDVYASNSTSTHYTQNGWDEPKYYQQTSKQSSFISEIDSQLPLKPLYYQNHMFGFVRHSSFSVNGSPDIYKTRQRIQSFYENATIDFTLDQKKYSDDFILKYKTEICKNFEFKGQCKWGDKVNLQVFIRTWYA